MGLNTNTIDISNFKRRTLCERHFTKNFFVIDIDSLNWINIVYIYAKLYAYFLETPTDFKKELEWNSLFRIYYSSSKTGVHIKCNIRNSLLENLFYRALFNDDIHRFRLDYLRLNREDKAFCYDVCFKAKTKRNMVMKKEFILQNPLQKIGMQKKTFYKLIQYIKQGNKIKIDLVLNNHLVQNDDYKSVFGEIQKGRELDMNEEVVAELTTILMKYKYTEVNDESKEYKTKYPLELAKSIYRFAKLHKTGFSEAFEQDEKDLHSGGHENEE